MLPFLKKPSDKTSTATVPAWHPNFRNFERLPDTKAVRTTFFINGLAVLIASSLVIYTGYREFGLRSLQADTDAAQKVVDTNKPASDEAITLFKKFQEEEKKVFALQSFLSSSRLVLSDFFLQIGASLPASVTLNSIDYKPSAVTLVGSISGAPDEASGQAVTYVDRLRKNEVFSQMFEAITLSNIARDPGTGQIRFSIDLRFKASTKAATGGTK